MLTELPINPARPQVMHIDLNSCFAMVEQQANPFLRGRPVAMTNRLTRGATIIAASYEAKRLDIGVGTKLGEARQLASDLVVLETDPAKYRHAHKIFSSIIKDYAPGATMKSVDEGVIDFSDNRQVNRRPLVVIAQEIKQRFKTALGEWITCNIGIATSRWLAKLAASLHKPDGLDILNSHNLVETYRQLSLTDLFGINRRLAARLRSAGIFTPLDFLGASEINLTKRVFHSINGHLWYWRLRGWEVDNQPSTTRTIGRQYVLHEFSSDTRVLAPIIMKMCEGVGRRMRRKGYCATGLLVSGWFTNHDYWYKRQKFPTKIYATPDIYAKAMQLFNDRPAGQVVKGLSITAYGLRPSKTNQLPLFETPDMTTWRLTDFMDELNDRYGEFSVMPGTMANTEKFVPEKIPFGSTRYF